MKSLTLLPGLAVLALSAPALAQQQGPTEPSDDVQTAIVYGDDAAPECPDNMICVVARMPESERYRIPESLRYSDDPDNTSWARRAETLEFYDPSGAFSCSPGGAAGFTGCTQELINAAYGERRESSAVRFSQLIEAAREERLSKIDEQAAAEQERVEAIEREYMERLERERAGEVPGETATQLPEPVPQPSDDGGEDASGLDREPGE